MRGRRLIDVSQLEAVNHSTIEAWSEATLLTSARTSLCSTPRAGNKLRPASARSIRSGATSARSSATSAGISKVTSPTVYLGSTITSTMTSRATSATSAASHTSTRGSRNGKMRKTSTAFALRCARKDILADFTLPRHGLKVWCIETQQLQPVRLSDHGFLHQGNVYIVLNVDDQDSVSLHVWHGSISQKVDHVIAMACVEELDRAVSTEGPTFVSLEFEGKESSAFLEHFQDGVIVCEGKTKQLLGRACRYQRRVYVIRGRKVAVAVCTDLSPAVVSPHVTLLLDGFPRTYVWIGDHVDYVSRVKAINLAKKMRAWQRDGRGHIVVIDKDEPALSDSFLQKLQNCGTAEAARLSDAISSLAHSVSDPAHPDNAHPDQAMQLFRLTGDRVMYDMPLVARRRLLQKFLTSTDVFLLDSGPGQAMYTWVGARAEPDARHRAMYRAMVFASHHGYPETTHVCRVTEGDEPSDFKRNFSHWRDRTQKDRQLVRSYSIANVGRVLFSRSDRRTVAKMEELWSDDHFITGSGTTEMWQVDGGAPPVSQSPEGLFYNTSCYILRHKEVVEGRVVQVLYTWLGSKSCCDDQEKAQQLGAEMDAALNHQTSLVRVLDGQEPKHFLSILSRSMIVFDVSLLSGKADSEKKECGRWMYCVREVAEGTMRVTQVSPESSSLNSSASYIIITDNEDHAYIWYGKNASAFEREYSKSIFAYLCPTKSHEYDIVVEGREPASMWEVVHRGGNYPREFSKLPLERRHPRLTLCRQTDGVWDFQNVPHFSQDDLCETELLIMDTYDQVHLWCGSAVPDKDHRLYSPVIQAYISADPSLRQNNDLKVWIVNQGSEPSTFYKFFPYWIENGYGGQIAYLASRKRVRQENALIDPDCQMVDMQHVHTTNISYKQLMKDENLPDDILPDHREHHLTDKEFTRVLRMSRAQFYRLPFWKQRQILKSARLVQPVAGCASSTPPSENTSFYL